MNVRELKENIIKAGEVAVKELIKVANEAIITNSDDDDDIAADKLKNAAASKKLAIFDAFEILKRIEDEQNILDGVEKTIVQTNKGFAESRAKGK
jgi:hypothetical protein